MGCMQRHFLKLKDVDIIYNQEFKSANDIFKACLVNVKREQKGETKHKDVISEEDREKCIPLEFCLQAILQLYKTTDFLEFLLFFCNRGRENVRKMEKKDFQICIDAHIKILIDI